MRGREEVLLTGSDRVFGLVIGGALAVMGVVMLVWGTGARWWFLAAGIFVGAALAAPRMLHPLNVIWFRFGLLLHAIVSPVVMALMFYGAVMPIGLLMRALDKRPLNLTFDPHAGTYWVKRPKSDRAQVPDSFRRQF